MQNNKIHWKKSKEDGTEEEGEEGEEDETQEGKNKNDDEKCNELDLINEVRKQCIGSEYFVVFANENSKNYVQS